jgi:F-type H+-transporting ATPase subunit delta
MSMKNPRVARRYAQALMSVAQDLDAVDTASVSLAMIGRVLGASRELRLLLASPIVPESKKASIVRELFQGRVAEPAMAFLDLLVRKHREVHLAEVITQFQALHDELRNTVTVEVTSAVTLKRDQEKALKAGLERRTGKTVRLLLAGDPSIMGGLVIRIGDTVLDASVTHQLARLREQFAKSS